MLVLVCLLGQRYTFLPRNTIFTLKIYEKSVKSPKFAPFYDIRTFS